MRRRALAASMLLLSTAACGALLGVDFEGRPRELGTEADAAGAEVDAAGAEGMVAPAAAMPDGPPRPALDAGYLARRDELASRRVRIADAPAGLDGYFTSRSWVYWVDASQVGHALRPVDGARRQLATAFYDASDTFVLTRSVDFRVTISTAEAGKPLATFERGSPSPMALEDAVVFFGEGNGSVVPTLAWRPETSPSRADSGTISALAIHVIGKSRHALYIKDLADAKKLWVLDFAPAGVREVSVPVQPMAVVETADGLVLSYLAGSETRYLLVKPTGPAADLTASIAAATSDVPVSERAAFGAPAAYGEWIVFSAKCGILALRPRDERLVAVQLRAPTDNLFFNGVRVAEASNVVVFSIAAGQQGLYYVRLDDLLRP